ncbi:hypothetical protein CANARDRAFT_79158 [[Candida] arabinofermentans NRRL YB-2248]|uniref:Uncharacterized protein n=1 Tax=[Candida] arabinofermentans NRRL YB-2248 TaxID=983967 RepID=A0A1E4SVM7_9ASCO|nr:hypothetical protein CANARDRAFT_79158 [[Candida] arabinofermentans NRRL YB-2248]
MQQEEFLDAQPPKKLGSIDDEKYEILSSVEVIPHLNSQNWSPNYANGIKITFTSLNKNYASLLQFDKNVLSKYNSSVLLKTNQIKSTEFASAIDRSMFRLQNRTARNDEHCIDSVFNALLTGTDAEIKAQMEISNEFESSVLKPLRTFIAGYQSFIARAEVRTLKSLQNYASSLSSTQGLFEEMIGLIDNIKEYKAKLTEAESSDINGVESINLNGDSEDDDESEGENEEKKCVPEPTDQDDEQITYDENPIAFEPFKTQYETLYRPVIDFKDEAFSLQLGLNGLNFDTFAELQSFLRSLKKDIFLETARIFLSTYTDVFRIRKLIKNLDSGFDYLTIESIINHLYDLKLIKFPSKKLSLGYRFKVDDDQIFTSWTPLFYAICDYDEEKFLAFKQEAYKSYKELKLKDREELRKKEAESKKQKKESASKEQRPPDILVKKRSTTISSLFGGGDVDIEKKLSEAVTAYKLRYELFIKLNYELLKKREFLEKDIVQLNNNIERKEFERIQIIYKTLAKLFDVIKLTSSDISGEIAKIHLQFGEISQSHKLAEFHNCIDSMSSGGLYVTNIRHNEFLANLNVNESAVFPNISKSIVLFGNDLSLQVKTRSELYKGDEPFETIKSLPYIVYSIFELIKDDPADKIQSWWLQPYNLDDVYKIRELYSNLLMTEMDPDLLDWSTDESTKDRNEFEVNEKMINVFIDSIRSDFNDDHSKFILLLKIFLLELNLPVIPPISMALENFRQFSDEMEKDSYLRELIGSMDRCSLATLLYILKRMLDIGDEEFYKQLAFTVDIPIVHLLYRPAVFHSSRKNDFDIEYDNDKFVELDKFKAYKFFNLLISKDTISILGDKLLSLQRRMEVTQRRASQNYENHKLKLHTRSVSNGSFKNFGLNSPQRKRNSSSTFSSNGASQAGNPITDENGLLTVKTRGRGIDVLGSMSRSASPSLGPIIVPDQGEESIPKKIIVQQTETTTPEVLGDVSKKSTTPSIEVDTVDESEIFGDYAA